MIIGHSKSNDDKDPGINFETSVLCDTITGKAIRNATDGEVARSREANAFNPIDLQSRGLAVHRYLWRPEEEVFAAPHVDGGRRFERSGSSIVTEDHYGAVPGLRSPTAEATVESEG